MAGNLILQVEPAELLVPDGKMILYNSAPPLKVDIPEDIQVMITQTPLANPSLLTQQPL